ncbi:Tim44 domain-containing protein [Desulfatitalea tepidiphila]|uniref:Tim44 domain-containing protein n=1 Tax=Desulfatitalea tepidiphila TaxID=1185843 RepID=UPI0009787A26|nr:Tim44-like domain-containing protein [Desulfatitalea tepidiphila]
MNRMHRLSICMIFAFAFSLFYLWQTSAEAARFGRSRSFGSKPTYQRSAQPPAQSPAGSPTKNGQTAQAQPNTGPTASPMGRTGGMLGGLLMGGLIGSLLFGGGLGAGGIGLLDILLIGGGLFLLFRFLQARRMAAASAAGSGGMAFARDTDPAWGWAGGALDDETESASPQQAGLPPGFDADEFLKGAQALYVRLQNAWDKRDLEDIRQFTSPEVFSEIQRQAEEDPSPGKTELLLITPRLLEVRDTQDQTIASVLFDVMLREDEDDLSKQVREVWHFSRELGNPDSFWQLEGIQQVAQ